MGWLFGSRPTTAGPSPAVAAAGSTSHRSLALAALLTSMKPEVRSQVLDLGPPIGSNIEWLSTRGGRVFVVDHYTSLQFETVESRAPDGFPRLLERLLPFGPDDRFDAVLSWDVFNYLRPDQVQALMTRVALSCRPGAQVLSFIATHKEMPAAPLRYRILAPDSLARDGAMTPTRAAPCYRQTDFARIMPTYRVKSSFLLRNGIQEYLFSARG